MSDPAKEAWLAVLEPAKEAQSTVSEPEMEVLVEARVTSARVASARAASAREALEGNRYRYCLRIRWSHQRR